MNYQHLLKTVVLVIVTLFLFSCTTMGIHKKPATPWLEAKSNIQAITSWDITASMSVQHQSVSQIVSVKWQERQRNFKVKLSGPLGMGAVRIEGQPGKVTLTRSSQESYSAATAEALLAKTTGWYLPIENLYYWIRSLPVPGQAYQHKLDSNGRLLSLTQGGWQIHYLDYHHYASGMLLPRKIQLFHPGLKIKLVISRFGVII